MTNGTKIPISLLSGFLGSGKTTLLNKLLEREEFRDTLIIINEFGETSLDHLLVENSTETIFELSNGCLCCSIRGELVDTLLELDRTGFKRIIIETTGIADPFPVFQSIASHLELAQHYIPTSISIVVDAIRAEHLINEHDEAHKQIAVADNIILTKLGNETNIEPLITTIKAINDTAPIFKDAHEISLRQFTQTSLAKRVPGHHSHDHSSAYQSIVLTTKRPLSKALLAGFIHHLSTCYGEKLLRVKGLVLSQENPGQPLIVQTSGQIMHDFEQLETWPDEVSQTTLVVIVKNTSTEIAQNAFDSFTNNIGIDMPDRQAMTNNPLSIPGF